MPVVNDQWGLTKSSLKGRGKIFYYVIGAERLTETRNVPDQGELYDWPIRIAQKEHFDYDQFVEAFRAALKHFAGRYALFVNTEVLEASIQKGREVDKGKHKSNAPRP